MFKKITSFILIFLLLFVVVTKKYTYAAAPLVLTPAVKYALGAGLTAAGVYAGDKLALDQIVQETWDNLSESSKRQWNTVVTTGSMVGHIVLSNDMWQNLIDSITTLGINAGNNDLVIGGQYEIYNKDNKYRTVMLGNDVYEIAFENYISYGVKYYRPILTLNGEKVREASSIRTNINEYTLDLLYLEAFNIINTTQWEVHLVYYDKVAGSYYKYTRIYTKNYPGLEHALGKSADEIINVIGSATVANPFRDYTNTRTNQRTIEVPPVPPDVWDDRWIDNLEKELNRTDNPSIDETSIQQEEVDWWLDEDGNIYKQPKGTPPRRDGDIKLIPPLTIPEIPDKPYIPENPPDRITEREIESPEITEVPHPSKPDTTIRTTTRTIERTTTRTDTETGRTTKTIETIIRTTIEEITYIREGVPLPEPEVTPIEETETQTKPPKTEVITDDTTINWEPLKVLPEKLTWKFPFSLPWDLLRAFENFESYGEWDAKIPIKFKVLHIDVDMELNLTPYSNIAMICKKIMILVLDISLILATRRLLGGAA